MLKVLWNAPAQYTKRWKKTLMLKCKCLLCGSVKDFRKVRVDNWQTKSCGCDRHKKVAIWDTFWELIVLVEWPRTQDKKKSRQFLMKCSCWKKLLVPRSHLHYKKSCWH